MKPIGYVKIDWETSAIVGDRQFMIRLWQIVKDQIEKHNKEVEKK